MSRRPGAQVTLTKATEGGAPPNRYVPLITADFRMHWPARVEREEVLEHLRHTYDTLLTDVLDWFDGHNPA